MSATAYVPVHTFKGGHSGNVNALAFAPSGRYLASGSDDQQVIIWAMSSGTQLYRIGFESAVDALLWHPRWQDTLIVACENGSLAQLCGLTLSGYERHDIFLGVQSHIYCIDFHPTTCFLAAGVGPAVLVTRETGQNKYTGASMRLPAPDDARTTDDPRHRAVALKFDRSGRRLIVTYLLHGVVCWNLTDRSSVWRIAPTTLHRAIGHSAISPDFRHVILHAFDDGLHSYNIGGGLDHLKHWRTYKLDSAPRFRLALQVSFVQEGRAIVAGTTTGQVYDVVVAVTGMQSGDFSYIATGTAKKGAETYIKIWKANIPGLPSSPTLPVHETIADAVMTHWNGWLPFSPDDAKRMFLDAVCTIALLLGLWGLFQLYYITPWRHIAKILIIAVGGMIEWAGKGCMQVGRIVSDTIQLGANLISWGYATFTAWIIAKILTALGLPLDVYERIPTE
ncbi:hypothetical protein FOMPIDRAFT_1055329 [Fomitopsis schrenkii]|uniref:Uncharacterized protein n=1 Tax=Fomitopsis schrenkii TaxID=2126942 RepID=S8F5P0_FOMSC|nr:hypothetical protein FOMPIDRAFT_1055329 [Fomitopsis schrenkii]